MRANPSPTPHPLSDYRVWHQSEIRLERRETTDNSPTPQSHETVVPSGITTSVVRPPALIAGSPSIEEAGLKVATESSADDWATVGSTVG